MGIDNIIPLAIPIFHGSISTFRTHELNKKNTAKRPCFVKTLVEFVD